MVVFMFKQAGVLPRQLERSGKVKAKRELHGTAGRLRGCIYSPGFGDVETEPAPRMAYQPTSKSSDAGKKLR